MSQRSQYKRKSHLVEATIDFEKRMHAFNELRVRWRAAPGFDRNIFTATIDWPFTLIDILAGLGLEPDEFGRPVGEIPVPVTTSPLVLLNQIISSAEKYEDGDGYDVQETLAWKAACLKAASLVWAGAIQFDEVKEAIPLAHTGIVEKLLTYGDLEAFWHGSGPATMTKEDIQAAWKNDVEFMDKDRLAQALRRRKG